MRPGFCVTQPEADEPLPFVVWTKMGNEQSTSGGRRPPKHKGPPKRMSLVRTDPEGSYLLISNENVEVFKFDPQETFMVAYAMDKQISPTFAHKTLSAATVVDAYQVICVCCLS